MFTIRKATPMTMYQGILRRAGPASTQEALVHGHRRRFSDGEHAAGGGRLAALPGHWNLGEQRPDELGLRHHQLRVVDRYRPRGNADLGHLAADAPAMA